MNKYALTLPLTVLSVFLGYFSSCLKLEHIFWIATTSALFVAAYGYLLFDKQQKGGEQKLKRRI